MSGESPAAQQPSVGRMVHYVARGSADGRFPPACRAAVVTEAVEYTAETRNGDVVGYKVEFRDSRGTVSTEHSRQPPPVGLAVLNPTGMFFHPASCGGARFDEGHEPAADPREGAAPIMCDGRVHAPGSWHWPARVAG